MKKALSLLLTAVMAVSLAACGSPGASRSTPDPGSASDAASASGAASGGDISLTFAWWGNQVRNEQTQSVLDLYARQNPGISFDGQFSEWGDYWTKLATVSAGHNLPDIIQMDYSYLKQYVDNGLLVDLQPYVDSGMLDVSHVEESVLDAGRIGDSLYALCIGTTTPTLAYNKTLLDEAGIEIKDHMDMEAFADICREVHEKTGYKTSLGYGSTDYLNFMLRSQGQSMYNEEGTALGMDSPEDLIPYFTFFETGISEGWMIGSEVYAEMANGSMEQNPLVYGSSPALRSWCGTPFSNQVVATQTAADAEGILLAVTTLPTDDPGASNYLRPSQFLSITTDSEHPDESVKVLDFWTNAQEANEILMGERGIPVSKEVASAIALQMGETDRMIVDFVNNVVTPNCSPVSAPAPEAGPEIETLHNTLQEAVCYGQMTAQEAAQQLFDEGNHILGNA